MAKSKSEKVETVTEDTVKTSLTTEDCSDCVVESQTGVSMNDVYIGVTPTFECMPTIDENELIADNLVEEPKLTAEFVINDIREFIMKHNAIAEGNGYKAEYINYKSLVDALLRKLSTYEV